MHLMIERTLQLPLDTHAKLLDDIHAYSALVDLQTKMAGAAPWFQKLA